MQPEDLEKIDAAPVVEQPMEATTPDVLFTAARAVVKREPFWDYYDLLIVMGLAFTAWLLVNFVAIGWVFFHPALKKDMAALALPIQYLAYGLLYLIFYCVFKVKYDQPVFRSLGFVRTGHTLLPWAVGGFVLAFGIIFVANFIHTPKVDTPFDELGKTPLSMALLALTAIVAAPLIEEMIFRGFLQPLFSRTLGTALGILLTAVLFGGLHASEYQFAWQYVAAISIVGIALGVLRARTKSTIPGTVMHGCFNAVSVVGLVAVKYFPQK